MKTVIGAVGLLSLVGFVVAACGGGDSGGGNGGGGGTGNTAGFDGGGMGGGGGSAAVDCTTDAECLAKMPATNPPDCAEAKCDLVLKKCNFVAKDADGDGHTAATCTAVGAGSVDSGDDCDDSDQNVYPGSTTTACTAGLGECLAKGFKTCVNGAPGCSATPGAPSPDSPLCDGKDHDCDGTPNSGCGCSAGEKQICHATDPDACNKDEILCSNGTWPACPTVQKKKEYCRDGDKDGYCDLKNQCGNWQCKAPDDTWKEKVNCLGQPNANDCDDSLPDVKPEKEKRVCASSGDSNCDGKADNEENECKCSKDGKLWPVGTSSPCGQHPQDGVGSCKAGTEACNASGNVAAWSACSGSIGPANSDGCDPGQDLDCDGYPANPKSYADCYQYVYTLVPPGDYANFVGGIWGVVSDIMWSDWPGEAGWKEVDKVLMFKTKQPGTKAAVRCANAQKHASGADGCPPGYGYEKTMGYMLWTAKPGFKKYGRASVSFGTTFGFLREDTLPMYTKSYQDLLYVK